MPKKRPTGWYPDPNNIFLLRYRDENGWTYETKENPKSPHRTNQLGVKVGRFAILSFAAVLGTILSITGFHVFQSGQAFLPVFLLISQQVTIWSLGLAVLIPLALAVTALRLNVLAKLGAFTELTCYAILLFSVFMALNLGDWSMYFDTLNSFDASFRK